MIWVQMVVDVGYCWVRAVIQKVLQYGHALMRQPYACCCEQVYSVVESGVILHGVIITILKSLQNYN